MALVTFDWGARSDELRKQYAKLGATRSSLLTKAATQVAVGTLTKAEATAWDTANPAALPMTAVAGRSAVFTTVPDTADFIRLDFTLSLTIGSATATCLEFRQLFAVGAGGALMPRSHSFEDAAFKAGPGPGATSPVRVAPGGRRVVLGASPLIGVTTTAVTINCEFLDVTELWWANWAAKDAWGWYLDPDLGGRPDLLRVLAWTSGTAPMLWFVALSPKAHDGGTGGTSTRPGADIVFFRAQAGFNSFRYSSDEPGFLHTQHGDTTMFHLARWLLTPLSQTAVTAKLAKTGSAPRPAAVQMAGVRLVPDALTPKIRPADPMDLMQSSVRWAFRPCGVETALAHGPSADIAFLPLGFDGRGKSDPFTTGGGYTALQRRDSLRDIIRGARALLWMRGAVGRTDSAVPAQDRQLWLLGNSAANRIMFESLRANVDHVDRVISLDATAAGENLLLTAAAPLFTAIAAKPGRTFKAVLVTSPNMWGDSKKKYLEIKTKLAATKADITMLPPDPEWDDYWRYPPTSNPLLAEVLSAWASNGLSASKRFGTLRDPDPRRNFQWLFWHEWVVNGGHLDTTPAPRLRHFIEDALRL